MNHFEIEALRDAVKRLITSIRESHIDSVYLYTQGQCYAFHKILKSVFGDVVECWYDPIEGHVYSKIDVRWYDIRGEWDTVSEHCGPIEDVGNTDHPDNWGKRDTRRLIDLARPTLEEAKDLTDFRPLKYLKGGLKRGEPFTLNSMDGGPIWKSKEPVTVVDVLALAEHKGYIGTQSTPELTKLLQYIGYNFRPKFVDTGLGYQQTNPLGDGKLIELAMAVGEVPIRGKSKKYSLEQVSDAELHEVIISRSNGPYAFASEFHGVCQLFGELELSTLEAICETLRRKTGSPPLMAKTAIEHDGLEDEDGVRIGPFQLTYAEALDYLSEDNWEDRLSGEISTDKGGCVKAIDAVMWDQGELEALCTLVRHRAEDNAVGVLELLQTWKELNDAKEN